MKRSMASVAECVSECAEEWRERESVEDVAECGECDRDGVMWLSVVSAVSVAKHEECGDCVGVCWSVVDFCCVWRNTVRVTDSVASVATMASERIECDGVWQSSVNVSQCVVVWQLGECGEDWRTVANVANVAEFGECGEVWWIVVECGECGECGGVW